MLDFSTDDPILSRFVRDLDERADVDRALDTTLEAVPSDPAELEAARVAWGVRVVDEYRSVVVFSELLKRLAEATAPYDCLATVTGLIGDELRHARLCAEALERVAGAGAVEIDLSGLALPPSDEPPAARAYEIVVRELAVAETESVPMIRAYRDACEEPFLRSVLTSLLRDEVVHAAAGVRLARRLEAAFPVDARRAVGSGLAERVKADITSIRETYRASAVDGPGRRLGASIAPADLPPPPDHFHQGSIVSFTAFVVT